MTQRKMRHQQFINNANITLVLIYLVVLAINICQTLLSEGGLLSALKIGLIMLIQLLTLITYMLLIDKPILSLMTLLGSQVISTIYSIIDSQSIKEGISDNLFSLLVITLSILIHTNIGLDKVDKDLSIKEKLLKVSDMTRYTLKVKWWAKLIVYSTTITVVMTLSRSDALLTLSSDSGVRLYGAIALVIPTLVILGILTTSELAYELLGFKLIIELYTLYKLYLIDSIEIKDIVYWVVQLGVLIWVMQRLRMQRDKKQVKKDDKQVKKDDKQVKIDDKQVKKDDKQVGEEKN